MIVALSTSEVIGGQFCPGGQTELGVPTWAEGGTKPDLGVASLSQRRVVSFQVCG